MIRITVAAITDLTYRNVIDVYFRLGWLAGLQNALEFPKGPKRVKDECVYFMNALPEWAWGGMKDGIDTGFRRPPWY